MVEFADLLSHFVAAKKMDFLVANLHQVDVVLGAVGFGGAETAAVVDVMTSVVRIALDIPTLAA